MSSNTGLVLLRELRPLYQARDQVVRGAPREADRELTGELTRARGRQAGVGRCGERVKANLVT